MGDQEQYIAQAYEPHIMTTEVHDSFGYLAVLSDIHEGLNCREYLQKQIDFIMSMGDNFKVVIGGDATNTVTSNSKGNVLEETLSGEEQIYGLIDDIKPLYDSGKLLGIVSGNHPDRVYNETYISIEKMIANLLGDDSLYKGSQGIVYFTVNNNTYVHYILHRHVVRRDAYDYFNADCVWKEHLHAPEVTPKVLITHDLKHKKPIPRICYEIKQPSFQCYPDYIKKSGGRPLPMGYYVCQMSGDSNNKKLTPIWNEDLKTMVNMRIRL